MHASVEHSDSEYWVSTLKWRLEMEASEEEEELHEMKETATMLSSLSVAALDPTDDKSELPLVRFETLECWPTL